MTSPVLLNVITSGPAQDVALGPLLLRHGHPILATALIVEIALDSAGPRPKRQMRTFWTDDSPEQMPLTATIPPWDATAGIGPF